MVNAIITNGDQRGIISFPCSRMRLAGELAYLGISTPPREIPCSDDENEEIQVKIFGETEDENRMGLLISENDSIATVNSLLDAFYDLPPQTRSWVNDWIRDGRITSLKEFLGVLNSALGGEVTETYYCPLTADYYSMDCYGYLRDESVELSGEDLPKYASLIREHLKMEQSNCNMAEYFDENNGAVSKLKSVVWDVEKARGALYGKITATLTEPFTDEERESFLNWVTGQNSDGLGEGFEQRPIRTRDGELYEKITDTYSVYYSGTSERTLTARINYAYRMDEVDPDDNICTTTVKPDSGMDDTYDFSVSNMRVSPAEVYQGEYVKVEFVTDNWNKDIAYPGILVEVLIGNEVVKSETVDFDVYGRNRHMYYIEMKDAGDKTITARINWAHRFEEDNSSNNFAQAPASAKPYDNIKHPSI